MGTRIASSRITAQGQTSVPAAVRRRLGAQPGSVLDWEDEEGSVVVRRAGEVTFEDIHKVLFPEGPPKRQSLRQLKQGIADYIRENAERRGY